MSSGHCEHCDATCRGEDLGGGFQYPHSGVVASWLNHKCPACAERERLIDKIYTDRTEGPTPYEYEIFGMFAKGFDAGMGRALDLLRGDK